MDSAGEKYHYLFKFVVVGNSGVGKSCIVLNFSEQNPRNHHQITIATEFGSRTIEVNNKKVRIQIWDTAGQENFRCITRSYYRSAVVALIVFDLTSARSFDQLEEWFDELKQNSASDIILGLIGNKVDLVDERVVNAEEAKKIAAAHGAVYAETSAFDLHSLEEVFFGMAKRILKDIDSKKIKVAESNGAIITGALCEDDYKFGSKLSRPKQQKAKKKCC